MKPQTIIYNSIEKARQLGITQQVASYDDGHPGGQVRIKDKLCFNFSSCSYLGLEQHPLIKEAMLKSIDKYGSQFSSSRAYLSIDLYETYESLLEQIFQRSVIVCPSVTLSHLSSLPSLIDPKKDFVIFDQQVHRSVRITLPLLQSQGLRLEVLRHNRVDLLEERLYEIQDKYEKVWYLADGVYSMHGDVAPFEELNKLLAAFSKFHCYVDDAHGMSWHGKRGCGLAVEKMKAQQRLFFSTSLNKSFAAAGAALCFSEEKDKIWVRNTGSTLTFSGPVQPIMLAAGIASAQIHLGDELPKRQAKLLGLIHFFIKRSKELNILLVDESISPIFFIGVGKLEYACDLVGKLKEKGFFVNIAAFPAVEVDRAGLRIPITNWHTESILNDLLVLLSDEMDQLFKTSKVGIDEVRKSFGV